MSLMIGPPVMLYDRVRAHADGQAQNDDVTMVVLRALDPSAASVRSAKRVPCEAAEGTIARRAL